MIIKAFVVGWILLVCAILINLISIKLGIETWYSFLSNVGKFGFAKAFNDASIVSKISLFVVYPFLLGLLVLALSRFK